MTKIVQMNSKEAEKLHVIKEVYENLITQKQWAEKLCITRQQMWRLVQKWIVEWDSAVIHGLTWKWSNNHEYDITFVQKIVHLPEYIGFWPTFMQEKLEEIHKIKISIETMRKILIHEWLWHPSEHKDYTYRQRRERKLCRWEMIQFDWSYHCWFEWRGEECCLLVAIDDATSELIHCKFTAWEWFNDIAQFWIEYVLKHGVPRSIYVDKFSTYKATRGNKREKDMVTNFTRIMWILWCKIIFANSPQAKWRVERSNKTLQDRLVKEMRLAWISNAQEGNMFLTQSYIPAHNKRFAVKPLNPLDTHQHNQYTTYQLDRLFSKITIRSLWNDYVVQYQSQYYQVLEWVYTVYPKKKIEVYETHLWDLYMQVDGHNLTIQKLEKDLVTSQRKQYRYKQHKLAKEKQKIEFEKRQKDRHETSKQRQEIRKQLELDLKII